MSEQVLANAFNELEDAIQDFLVAAPPKIKFHLAWQWVRSVGSRESAEHLMPIVERLDIPIMEAAARSYLAREAYGNNFR